MGQITGFDEIVELVNSSAPATEPGGANSDNKGRHAGIWIMSRGIAAR
jgi:hypothetical protein